MRTTVLLRFVCPDPGGMGQSQNLIMYFIELYHLLHIVSEVFDATRGGSYKCMDSLRKMVVSCANPLMHTLPQIHLRLESLSSHNHFECSIFCEPLLTSWTSAISLHVAQLFSNMKGQTGVTSCRRQCPLRLTWSSKASPKAHVISEQQPTLVGFLNWQRGVTVLTAHVSITFYWFLTFRRWLLRFRTNMKWSGHIYTPSMRSYALYARSCHLLNRFKDIEN